MNLVKTFSTLSMAAAAAWMLIGAQNASQAQSLGVLGSQQLTPAVKLTIKANGWMSSGTAQGTEYFGTASWNISACFKQLAFSQDADGTETVDAMAYGTFYDTVNYAMIKANVSSHFVKRSNGTNEAHVTITNAKTGTVLYSNETDAPTASVMVPGALISIVMP